MWLFFRGNPISVDEKRIEDIKELSEKATPESEIELYSVLEDLLKSNTPYDIPSPRQIGFIQILIKSNAWPPPEAKPILCKDIKNTKKELLEIISNMLNVHLKINALLQSLCKQTFLGNIFYTPRFATETSLDRGSLLQIVVALESLIVDNKKFNLTVSTISALIKEEKRSGFVGKLAAYPNLSDYISSQVKNTDLHNLQPQLTKCRP